MVEEQDPPPTRSFKRSRETAPSRLASDLETMLPMPGQRARLVLALAPGPLLPDREGAQEQARILAAEADKHSCAG